VSALTKLELEHAIGIHREHRDRLLKEKLELQERHRAHIDGTIEEALIAVDNELFLTQAIVAKLWQMLVELK
jgi:hypothetical protein